MPTPTAFALFPIPMKALLRRLACFHALLLILFTGGTDLLLAQDAAAGKSALTFERFPYSFDSSNPLKPGSPVVNSSQGGGSKDTWVLHGGAVTSC